MYTYIYISILVEAGRVCSYNNNDVSDLRNTGGGNGRNDNVHNVAICLFGLIDVIGSS